MWRRTCGATENAGWSRRSGGEWYAGRMTFGALEQVERLVLCMKGKTRGDSESA